jgi:hypothetical protein
VKPLMVLHSNCRAVALPTNIRLEWEQMAVAHTLAYYDAATITAIVQAPKGIPGEGSWKWNSASLCNTKIGLQRAALKR